MNVKELITELLDFEMDWEVEMRNKNNVKMKAGCKLVAVKPEGLSCLFG